VTLSKTSEATLYSRMGSLLSATGLLAIFLYQMMLNNLMTYGGMYPSGGILLLAWPLLAFGAVFGFYGARMLRSRIGLVIPAVGSATLLLFIVQFEWCLHYCVHP
jgi:hypothetical protein